MSKITRIGYGQVEPNHLSAQKTGQIYAQLPANSDITILEQGQFVKYDYVNNEVNFTGDGEWMLVYNEEKLYDEREQSHRHFALKADDFTPGSDITHGGLGPFKGQMTPRVFKTNVGDIFTLNTFGENNTSGNTTYDGIEITAGTVLSPNTTGFLAEDGDGTIKFKVVKITTMPDGQIGVKVQRIA